MGTVGFSGFQKLFHNYTVSQNLYNRYQCLAEYKCYEPSGLYVKVRIKFIETNTTVALLFVIDLPYSCI